MLRKPQLLFEHESKEYTWTDRELRLLDALNRRTGSEVLRERNGRVQATQFVGVVRLGEQSFQILPKIHRKADRNDSEHEATANLLYMLAYAADVPISEQGVVPLLSRNSDWFEVLTHLFISHLATLWQCGAIHDYRTLDQELGMLKGKWRIADQLRQPAGLHRFYVTNDEFSADTDINRALRFVVERLWQLTRDRRNRHQLELMREWMDDVTLLKVVTSEMLDYNGVSRLNHRYVPVINLARLFLQDGALQLAHDTTQAYSFVFDMNLLFESFVFGFLQRHRVGILPPGAQEWKLIPQARGCMLNLAWHHDNRAVFALKPDIVVRNSTGFPLLIDTKYKRLDPKKYSLGVDSGDFYQMHAYASRYQCPRVILLYPQTVDHPKPLHHTFHLHNTDAVVELHTIDLCRELSSRNGRDDLAEQMQAIIQEKANLHGN